MTGMNGFGRLFGMVMVAVALCAVPAVEAQAQQLQRKQLVQTQQQRSDAAYAAFNAGDYDKAFTIAQPLAEEGYTEGQTLLALPVRNRRRHRPILRRGAALVPQGGGQRI